MRPTVRPDAGAQTGTTALRSLRRTLRSLNRAARESSDSRHRRMLRSVSHTPGPHPVTHEKPEMGYPFDSSYCRSARTCRDVRFQGLKATLWPKLLRLLPWKPRASAPGHGAGTTGFLVRTGVKGIPLNRNVECRMGQREGATGSESRGEHGLGLCQPTRICDSRHSKFDVRHSSHFESK